MGNVLDASRITSMKQPGFQQKPTVHENKVEADIHEEAYKSAMRAHTDSERTLRSSETKLQRFAAPLYENQINGNANPDSPAFFDWDYLMDKPVSGVTDAGSLEWMEKIVLDGKRRHMCDQKWYFSAFLQRAEELKVNLPENEVEKIKTFLTQFRSIRCNDDH